VNYKRWADGIWHNHKIEWMELDKDIADTAKRYRQVKGEVSIV